MAFTRNHTINGYAYTEALESYRDPVSRKPKHRVLARWPAGQSLAEAIAEAAAEVKKKTESQRRAVQRARSARETARNRVARAKTMFGFSDPDQLAMVAEREARRLRAINAQAGGEWPGLARAEARLTALRRIQAALTLPATPV